MARRNLRSVWVVIGIHAFIFSAAALGGDNTPEPWNISSARQYLDRRGEEWFKFGGAHRGQGESTTSCVSCHSLLPYALARPVLRRLSDENVPTKWEQKILDQAPHP